MLVFDRPNFLSGAVILSCPEKREVDGEVVDVVVQYTLRKRDVGKEFKFPNEAYMRKKHGINFRDTEEWTQHHKRAKELRDASKERRRLLDLAQAEKEMRKGIKKK